MERKNQKLLNACEQGNLLKVKKLLNRFIFKPDVNCMNKSQVQPLHFACGKNGNIEIVQLLIGKGAGINIKTDIGNTPLILATSWDHNETAKLLIHNGAEINVKNNDGQTPLLFAFGQKTDIELVKLHIEKGAEINVKNNKENTPLILSSSWDLHEITRLLIEKGAEINVKNNEGRTPLMFASGKNGSVDIVKLMIDNGAEINAKANDGNTALHKAAYFGRNEIAGLLINNGANVNAANSESVTPLHQACSEPGPFEMAELLVEKGADINTKTSLENTPLILAVSWGHKKIVKLLVDKGADINVKNKDGWTPLLYASGKSGSVETAELLINKGAEVNVVAPQGFTPLTIATSWGHKDIVELLIKNKTNVNAVDEKGESSLRKAEDRKFNDIMKLLIDNGAISSKPAKPEPSLSEKLQSGMEFLNSDSFRQEIEKAKRARDQAGRDEYKRQGSPEYGASHVCSMCYKSAYGEETILRLLREAEMTGDFYKAAKTEQQSAYRCKQCGKIFCKDCLEKKAPGNSYGGKSCPVCNGLFEIVHG